MARRLSGWHGLEPLEQRSLLSVVTWDGGGGDLSWHNPLNWSGDVLPGLGDDVVIDTPGTGTIRHSQNVTTDIASLWSLEPLELSAGTIMVQSLWRQAAPLTMTGGRIEGLGDLLLNADMAWSGGAISGTGKMKILPGRKLRLAGDVALGRQIVNNGSLVWESGDVSAQRAVILNLAGRTFEMRSGGRLVASFGTNIISNFGTIVRTGSAGTTSTVEVWLHNRGEVAAIHGTLAFSGPIVQREDGGILRAGIWSSLSSDATLDLSGGPILRVIGGDETTGPAVVRLHGVGAQFPQLESVTVFEEPGLTFHPQPARLELSGGRAFTFSSLVSVDRLVISNPGITTAVGPGVYVEALGVGAGTVRWAGGGKIGWAHIVAGAELVMEGTTRVFTVSGLGLLRVRGRVDWTSGAWVGGPVLIEPSGLLHLGGFFSHTQMDPQIKVLARRTVNYGTILWDDLWGSWRLGAELVNRGIFNVGPFASPLGGPQYLDTNSGLGPTGTPEWITNYGTINVDGQRDVVLRGAGGGVRLANMSTGTVRVVSGRLVANGGGLSTGAFDVESGAEMAWGGLPAALSGASLFGAGNYRVAGPLTLIHNSPRPIGRAQPGAMVIGLAGRLLLLGTMVELPASATTNNGVVAVGPGGRVGTFGTFANNGLLDLDADSVFEVGGTLSLGSESVFRVGIASPTGFARVGCGSIVQGGQLVAGFGYAPSAGAQFDFMQIWQAKSGAFSSVIATGLGDLQGVVLEWVNATQPGVVFMGRLRVV